MLQVLYIISLFLYYAISLVIVATSVVLAMLKILYEKANTENKKHAYLGAGQPSSPAGL
jgi:hypothetical protein